MTAVVVDAPQTFFPLKIGGGGYVSGHDMHPDGTLVCRCDVSNGYIWSALLTGDPDPDDHWIPLVTELSMPPADVGPERYDGVYEIRIAPSNSSIFYMVYFGYVWKTANKGTNWTKCAAVNGAKMTNMTGNHSSRGTPLKLAIDPLNPDVVYLGTTDIGLWRTQDGGDTWVNITDVPVGTGSAGGTEAGVTGIIFDPTSSSTTTDGVTCTATVWCSSYDEGAYLSTDGGITFANSAGPASNFDDAKFTSTGILYVATNNPDNKLWRYDGSWTDLSSKCATTITRGIKGVAIDPFDEDRILVFDAGGLPQQSLDAAATNFGVRYTLITTLDVTDDIPWLIEHGNRGDNISVGNWTFHPTIQNRILCSCGVGFFYMDLIPNYYPVPGANVWHSMTRGIEELVTQLIVSTPNGDVFLGCQDRPLWKVVDPDVYPTSELLTGNPNISHCSSIDYLGSDPDFICTVTNIVAGYSSDAGANWTNFPTIPSAWGGGALGPWPNSHSYGTLCCGSTTNFVWFPGNAKQPYYTLDAGETWIGCEFPNVNEDATANGWQGFYPSSYFIKRRIVCADYSTPGTFYAHHTAHGVYKTVDGGATWTRERTTPVTLFMGVHAKLKNPYGKAGHLWATPGPSSSGGMDAFFGIFSRCINGNLDTGWETIPDVLEVNDFGWGLAAPSATYPTLFIQGAVNGVWGSYYSTNSDAADVNDIEWTKIGNYPLYNLDLIMSVEGDKLEFGKAYFGFGGSGFVYTTQDAPEPEPPTTGRFWGLQL